MINSEVLAELGLFFIAALAYAFVTGVAGLVLSIGMGMTVLCYVPPGLLDV